MELVERYIYEVTRQLSPSQRDEVAEELRAIINDMLSAKTSTKNPSKKQVVETLKELGPPEKLAHEYKNTPQYLISPRWFHLYWRLLKKLVLFIPPIVAIIISIVEMAETNRIFDSLATGIGTGVGAAIQITFWTTLIFAIVDYTGAKPEPETATREWSPEMLPKLPPKRQISVSDSILGIGFTLLVAGFVVYAITWPAWWTDATAPVLNPELWGNWVMQGFLLLIAISLVLEGWKLKVGNWTLPLTVANTLIAIAWAVFLVFALLTQPLINPAFIDEMPRNADLMQATPWIIGISVAFVVLSSLWSSGESIYKAVLYRRPKGK